jgi:hypothetical protein
VVVAALIRELHPRARPSKSLPSAPGEASTPLADQAGSPGPVVAGGPASRSRRPGIGGKAPALVERGVGIGWIGAERVRLGLRRRIRRDRLVRTWLGPSAPPTKRGWTKG